MGGQGSIHGCAHHSKVVLLLDHELLQCLHGSLLFSRFRIDYALRIVVRTSCCLTFSFRGVNRWIGTAFLFSETEIDEVYEMSFI